MSSDSDAAQGKGIEVESSRRERPGGGVDRGENPMSVASGVATQSASSSGRWVKILVPAILLILVGWLLVIRGLQRDLNHDEHQFLAPGALLSREGLLPFRDYPLFHLPNLVFAYAALDKLTGWPVLSAKLLSIAASIGLVAFLGWLVWREKNASLTSRAMLGTAAVALLIFDPVFLYTMGKTWNHEVPTFLICAAIILQAVRFSRPSLGVAALCGLLGGLSAGCRLTFGPMLIPLFVAAWLVPGSRAEKLKHGFMWGVGAFFGLLPSIWLFLLSPEPFLFGNLEFPRLRLSDPTNLRIQKTVRLSAKLRYFVKEIILPSWPMFLAYLAIAARSGWFWLRYRRGSVVCGFVLAVLPFALFGCFAPSRYQYQHFFGIIGLLSVGVAGGIVAIAESFPMKRRLLLAGAATAAAVLAGALHDKAKYLYPIVPPPLAEWFPVEFHERAQLLRTHVQTGRVLTLAPAWPIEAGLSTYPEFASGPFAWRSAHLVPGEQRARLDLVAPADLERFLAAHPPAAILTGYEDKELEKLFIEYARRHGYRPVRLERKRDIWLPAGAQSGGRH